MKQKINDQLDFAFKRYESAQDGPERFKWGGYIQGLRFVLTLLPEEKSSGLLPDEQPLCVCGPQDLQPFGECPRSNTRQCPSCKPKES